jgi:hypothetical protein
MHPERLSRLRFLAGLVALMTATTSLAVAAPKPRPLDLADVTQGIYHGDVISDSKGSSRKGVTVTVTRIGRNLVRITSDYDRLPVVTVPLEKAMDAIINHGGETTFVVDTAKSPRRLDVTFNGEVAWSGER